MKKIKTLLFSTTPFFLCIGMQFIAVFYLLFLAGIYLFVIAPAVLGQNHSIDEFFALAADTNFNTIASILFSVLCIFTFSYWLKSKKFGERRKLDIKKDFHPYEILGIALLVPGTQFLSSIVTGCVSMIFPSWLEEYEALLENAGLVGDIPLLMMVYSVCLAPIGEELAFRGVTMRIAKRAFPFWFANIIQALLFGLFHMNPLQACYTFVVGLFMGYICEKGGSIYHSILFHFLFNLWGTTASQWLLVEDTAVQGFIIFAGTALGLTYGLRFLKKGVALKQPAPEPEVEETEAAITENETNETDTTSEDM